MKTLNKQIVPRQYESLFERAADGKSPTSAIRAACLACVGFSAKEVRLCTAPDCPLYPYRLGRDQQYRSRKRDAESRSLVLESTQAGCEASYSLPAEPERFRDN